ncbi:MAG: hypothetical protein MJ230_01630 [bacterium]|nr:hypothetical protein [bacterium]
MKLQCVYENEKMWVQKFLNNGKLLYYVCFNTGGYYNAYTSKSKAVEVADKIALM